MFDFFLHTPSIGQVLVIWFLLGWVDNILSTFFGYRHHHRGRLRGKTD